MEINDYPVTASTINTGSFFDIDQLISSGPNVYQSQKVPAALMKALMLSENVVSIHYADLVILAAANGLSVLKQYYIDDSAAGSSLILVRAATVSTLFQSAFDLTTGETGIYVLSTDKFTPLVQTWSKSLTAANIIAGGYFDILQLPAVPAFYWNIESCIFAFTHNGVDFDGASRVSITADGATATQYGDAAEILASTANFIGRLTPAEQTAGSVLDNVKANAKMQVYLNNPSTVGDGTLKLQGTARLLPV